MVLDHADVILGKLALGRSYVSRPDALRIADEVQRSSQTGRRESFGQAAVRLGYLQPAKADELLAVLQTGMLICRGSCGQSFRLSGMTPDQTAACGQCRGPLFVSKQTQAAPAAPAKEEGSGTFMELDTPAFAVDPAAPTALEPPPPGAQPAPMDPSATAHEDIDVDDVAGNTFLDLEIELPDDGGGGSSPPPAETQVPAAGGGAEGTLEIDLPTHRFGAASVEPFSIAGQAGPIAVSGVIGKGGMGTVYRARSASGQDLAVKVLDAQAALTDEAVQRFQREVRLATGLGEHPRIVRVHEAGVVDAGPLAGRPYYTMDFVPGRDLVAWLHEQPRSPAEICRIMAQVCEAMDYAHGRGVVHRDLKPGNVLIDAEGRPQVVDFGLAKTKVDLQNLTQTGDILGTPNYMPPEQALGNRKLIGPPTDVYALGAILYFLLTGKVPFKAPSAFATIAKVVKEPPRPPRELNAEVSAELEAIVLKALAKEPVGRFHTCGELGRALTALGD